jgi:hypothetical protein
MLYSPAALAAKPAHAAKKKSHAAKKKKKAKRSADQRDHAASWDRPDRRGRRVPPAHKVQSG